MRSLAEGALSTDNLHSIPLSTPRMPLALAISGTVTLQTVAGVPERSVVERHFPANSSGRPASGMAAELHSTFAIHQDNWNANAGAMTPHVSDGPVPAA